MSNMQDGASTPSFDYSTPDGQKRTASLEPTYYDQNGPFYSTHDPMWILSGVSAKQVWIGYTGGDGQLWFSKIHSKYDSGLNRINSHYEHRGPARPGVAPEDLPEADYGDNDINKGLLGFKDWNGLGWHALLSQSGNNQAPIFTLRKANF